MLHTALLYAASFWYCADRRRQAAAANPSAASRGASRHSNGKLSALVAVFNDPVRLRNYLAAPLTEEFVFRACMAPLWRLAGASATRAAVLTPLFFGAAHLHHLHQLVTFDGLPLGPALRNVAFQFAYTTAFGWYAARLFLAARHLAAPVAAHVLCNVMGFPPLGEMASHPTRAIGYLAAQLAGMLLFGLTFGSVMDSKVYAAWSNPSTAFGPR